MSPASDPQSTLKLAVAPSTGDGAGVGVEVTVVTGVGVADIDVAGGLAEPWPQPISRRPVISNAAMCVRIVLDLAGRRST